MREDVFSGKIPMKGLKHPKTEEKEIRFLSIDEIYRLLDVIENQQIRDMVLMYIHTGARRLEILKSNFTWESVDFINKKITLLGKRQKIRSIPMDEVVAEILRRRKNIEGQDIPFDYSYDWVYRRIKKYYKLAGIDNANVHTLRKTFGSLLVQQDVNIYTVSKLMGHSSVVVTERYYASLIDRNLREGVKSLDILDIK